MEKAKILRRFAKAAQRPVPRRRSQSLGGWRDDEVAAGLKRTIFPCLVVLQLPLENGFC